MPSTSALEPTPTSNSRWAPTVAFVLIAIGLNLIALALAWRDQSWFAFGLALYFGPAVNLLLALASLALTPTLRHREHFPTAWHAVLSVLVPASLAGLDAVIIFAMPLHGC